MSDHVDLDALAEALNPDLIGWSANGRYTMPKPHFSVIHAAARAYLDHMKQLQELNEDAKTWPRPWNDDQ